MNNSIMRKQENYSPYIGQHLDEIRCCPHLSIFYNRVRFLVIEAKGLYGYLGVRIMNHKSCLSHNILSDFCLSCFPNGLFI